MKIIPNLNPYKKLQLIMLSSFRNWKNNLKDYMLYAIICNEKDADIVEVVSFFIKDYDEASEVIREIIKIRDVFKQEHIKFSRNLYNQKERIKRNEARNSGV